MRIPDELLECVVYIFDSEEAALSGALAGGSGFVVGLPLGVNDAVARFVVTNHHVVRAGGHFVRLTGRGERVVVVHVSADRWVHAHGPDDISVAPLELEPGTADYKSVLWQAWAVTESELATEGVGPGDEVAMLGRFMSRQGVVRNEPVARFGHISLMPTEKVRDGNDQDVEAMLVELRSDAGFSGSPVLLLIPPMSLRPRKDALSAEATIGLLGMITGHYSLLASDGKPTKDNTGVSIVTPAWRIDDVLQSEPVLEHCDRLRRSLQQSR